MSVTPETAWQYDARVIGDRGTAVVGRDSRLKRGIGRIGRDREDLFGKRLSGQETRIVKGIAEGLSNKEIGHKLGISEGTVKVYASYVFGKLGVYSRIELALRELQKENAVLRLELQKAQAKIAGL